MQTLFTFGPFQKVRSITGEKIYPLWAYGDQMPTLAEIDIYNGMYLKYDTIDQLIEMKHSFNLVYGGQLTMAEGD